MTGHYVSWLIADDTPSVIGNVVCHEPAGALCRTYCVRDECEEGCLSTDSHERQNQETCNIADWLNGDGLADTYDGRPTRPRDGAIVAEWTGDGMSWRYARTTK